jgi:hypothetical protein
VRIQLSAMARGSASTRAASGLEVADRELTVDGEIVTYDPATEVLAVDVAALGLSFPSGGTVDVKLLALADRNGNSLAEQSWAFRVGPDV